MNKLVGNDYTRATYTQYRASRSELQCYFTDVHKFSASLLELHTK